VAEPGEAAAVVAHQLGLGASVVKTTLNRDAGPVPDVATLQAVVDAAAEAGLPVVAHCQGPGMVELALAAGVTALAHTPWTHRLDDEVVAEAVEAGHAWVSTLDIHGYGTSGPDQHRAVDNLGRFRAAGGRVLYGTDLGNGPLPETLNLREVALLADAGLTDDDLLAALTDPWPLAEPLSGLATEVPDGPEPLVERLAGAHVVRTEG
jgi:imidazolonepropionase-like amidohydrolase